MAIKSKNLITVYALWHLGILDMKVLTGLFKMWNTLQ